MPSLRSPESASCSSPWHTGRSSWSPHALASTAFVGILLGCSIHTAGSLFTFACLVLPPLAAKSLCTTTRSMFVVAPILAGSSCLLAFMLADYYDYPPGQLAAGLLAGLVLLLRLLIRR
ncbi:MAG: metal ABC transporter permease, partial [Planctomycetota bacterium]